MIDIRDFPITEQEAIDAVYDEDSIVLLLFIRQYTKLLGILEADGIVF